jgi:hypothetical protein
MYTRLLLSAALFLGQMSVPAGMPVEARLETTVNTATSRVGDEVLASLNRSMGSGSSVAVPRGSLLRGRVETIQAATADSEGRVRLVFREIQFAGGQRVQTWITNSFTADTPKRNARYIAYTAIGATAGGLIGGKTARVAGIFGGTIVGFVLAGSRNPSILQNLTLKAGEQIQLELREDLVISSTR